MIDWKKTKEKYGYEEKDLPPSSENKVIWRCDNDLCQAPLDVREREHVFKYAKKKRELAEQTGCNELCQRCSHNHRKGISSEKPQTHKAQPLPPECSDDLTLKEFGYKASELAPWSREPVVLVFVDEDGKESTHMVKRAQLNTNRAVVETGHYKPIAWYTKQRRKNIKASKETKDLMKKSQNLRREREKLQQEHLRQKRIQEILQPKKVA